jgi:adenylate kinase
VRRLTGRHAQENRTDDDPETVRRRIQVYRTETEPVIRSYLESGVRVVRADGVGPIDEIQQDLREQLGL